MKITPYRTAVFQLKESLPDFIFRHVPLLREGDILAVASKLICLWQGCAVDYQSPKQKEKLIYRQSQAVVKTKLAYLTLKNGMIMTNGGVDESNAQGRLLYLPDNLAACTAALLLQMKKKYQVRKLGLIITDSMILPLRTGVIGAAVAYRGFKGVRDERGKKDIFGKPLRTTFVNLADGLAAAAAVTMGERRERCPLCRIEGAPVCFVQRTNPAEMSYPLSQDLYAPLLKAGGLIKGEEKNEKHNW